MTRKEAVEQVLQGAGQYRISALDTNGTSIVADAEYFLNQCMVEVQSMRWHYNTKTNVDLSTDGSGVATVPTGTTSIDTIAESASKDVTQLGDHLYDRENNTTNLGESSTVKVEYTLNYRWECIPVPIRIYVVKCATVHLCTKLGRRELLPMALAEREKFYVRAVQFDTEMADHNLLGTTEASRVMGRRDQIGRFDTAWGAW